MQKAFQSGTADSIDEGTAGRTAAPRSVAARDMAARRGSGGQASEMPRGLGSPRPRPRSRHDQSSVKSSGSW